MPTMHIFELSPLLHAAALELGHPVTGDVRWLHLAAGDIARLTASDRDLVHVVTGERLDDATPESGRLVSFFTLQLAMDRAAGALLDGRDASIAYVEQVFTTYDTCPHGNPMSDDLFDFALAYLVGRDLARADGPDAVHV